MARSTRLGRFTIASLLCVCLCRGATGQVSASAKPDILRREATERATEYHFSAEDTQLLSDVQRGCFQYLWLETHPESGLVRDRRSVKVCSAAGVGFQLSSLPIGVERGWITRQQGYDRALRVLRTLTLRDDNRKFGVFLHFVDLETGGILPGKGSELASTIDHALLLAGCLPAAEYFGGEVATIVDAIADDTDWKSYDVAENGFISMGWRPERADLNGKGDFVPWNWHFASDEELLVYFLACGSEREDFAGDPRDYYRLERNIKRYRGLDPFVVSWNGSMFTYFFAHCWIDYRGLAADRPAEFGVSNPRVDWFENSRRATLTHRQRCIDAADRFPTLGENRWGFAPCMGRKADGREMYLVQSLRPNISSEENFEAGAVAPYAAGSAIMFTPAESVAALREFKSLKDAQGEPLVWRDPEQGGYGFADSFSLDPPLVSDDNVAIDVGPMLLAIENVRTGLIWRLFMQHEVAERAVKTLKLEVLDAEAAGG